MTGSFRRKWDTFNALELLEELCRNISTLFRITVKIVKITCLNTLFKIWRCRQCRDRLESLRALIVAEASDLINSSMAKTWSRVGERWRCWLTRPGPGRLRNLGVRFGDVVFKKWGRADWCNRHTNNHQTCNQPLQACSWGTERWRISFCDRSSKQSDICCLMAEKVFIWNMESGMERTILAFRTCQSPNS